MPITEEDITLKRFLQFFTTTTNPEAGKIKLSDADFVLNAAILKLVFEIQALKQRI